MQQKCPNRTQKAFVDEIFQSTGSFCFQSRNALIKALAILVIDNELILWVHLPGSCTNLRQDIKHQNSNLSDSFESPAA